MLRYQVDLHLAAPEGKTTAGEQVDPRFLEAREDPKCCTGIVGYLDVVVVNLLDHVHRYFQQRDLFYRLTIDLVEVVIADA